MGFALRLALISALAALPAATSFAYDDAWYQADFWGGEYPNGFSVLEATTLPMRAEPDPDYAPTLECPLPAGAVYHPWNVARVEADVLAFRSYTRKERYTLDADYAAILYTENEWDEVALDMSKGDAWTYLAYLGEGAFLMDYKGATYVGEQSLIEVSTTADEPVSHEWLQLICLNGGAGWLLLDEVSALPTIGEPNIVTYGEAADLDP